MSKWLTCDHSDRCPTSVHLSVNIGLQMMVHILLPMRVGAIRHENFNVGTRHGGK
jgi:hypothetical protein